MKTPIPPSVAELEHFLTIRDLDGTTLETLIDFAIDRKQTFRRGELEPVLRGKVLAMIFQKSSLRTRLGFEAAMVHLGGHAINLEDHQVGLTRREDVRDVARVIASMCDGIMARVFDHQLVVDLAEYGDAPVINGLSDWAHPCQALADLMTVKEHFGELAGRRVAYVGDANNVARSLLWACLKTGVHFAIGAPKGYQLDRDIVDAAAPVAARTGSSITESDSPVKAVADADVVYTDVWTSMGQEAESAQREKAFAGFQLNAELMAHAHRDAVVMHCLPAHRGQEITDDVLDGPQSIVFAQAENRLHSQRALLEVLMG